MVAAIDWETLVHHEVFKSWWYYNLELFPGVITDGRSYNNIVPLRRLLRGVDVAGARALDIGAMEGLMSVLLCRRGARQVVAYDRMPNPEKIELVQRCLDCSFSYHHTTPMSGLRALLKEHGTFPLDVVLFSGVLYHMFDPLAGLAIARGLVRDGGILILETGALLSDDMSMHFNDKGRFYPVATNYWFASVALLDYLLRYLRLRPLDCAYLPHKATNGHELIRTVIVCRAETAPLATPDDSWMRAEHDLDVNRFSTHETQRNFQEFLDYEELASTLPPVGYERQHTERELVYRKQIECVDVYQSLKKMGPTITQAQDTILKLSDMF